MNNKELILALDNRAIRIGLINLPKLEPAPDTNAVEVLLANGFTYCGYCKCSGTTNYKYSKGNYVVYFLPKRKTFHIKLVNNYITKNQPVNKLCSQLNNLGLLNSKITLAVNIENV